MDQIDGELSLQAPYAQLIFDNEMFALRSLLNESTPSIEAVTPLFESGSRHVAKRLAEYSRHCLFSGTGDG